MYVVNYSLTETKTYNKYIYKTNIFKSIIIQCYICFRNLNTLQRFMHCIEPFTDTSNTFLHAYCNIFYTEYTWYIHYIYKWGIMCKTSIQVGGTIQTVIIKQWFIRTSQVQGNKINLWMLQFGRHLLWLFIINYNKLLHKNAICFLFDI